MNVEHKEYASKGVAGTGLGLGIAGTALGLINGGNVGGGLGGIFGGGTANQVQTLMSENAQLKAEASSAKANDILKENLLKDWLKPIADEVADSRVREARMQAEIDCLKTSMELKFKLAEKDVALVKQEMTCCCTANATAIAQVQAILGNVTKLVVPNSAICPGWGTATVTVTPSTTTAGGATGQ